MTNQKFDPQYQLHEILDSGEYSILFRYDDRDEIVDDHDRIGAAFEADETPCVVLHRPNHLFLRPAVLGERLRETAEGAVLDLDDAEVTLTELRAVEGLEGVVIARIAGDGPTAHAVATHPSLDGGDMRGVSVVHGFRFWNHIAWFCESEHAGPWSSFTTKHELRGAPANFPAQPVESGTPTGAIGLLDTGVDKKHTWMDNVDEIPPTNGTTSSDDATNDRSHGTMVAGVLRQTAPDSPVYSYRVDRLVEHVADEQQIVDGLNAIKKDHPSAVVVMAFGGEQLPDKGAGGKIPLEEAINSFVDSGGTVFAAAGNLTKDTRPRRRTKVYPAAWENVHPVAGATQTGSGGSGYYHWSNGWGSAAWPSPSNGQAICVTNANRPGGRLFTSYGVTDVDGEKTDTFAKTRGTSLLVAIAAGAFAQGKTIEAVNPFPDKV